MPALERSGTANQGLSRPPVHAVMNDQVMSVAVFRKDEVAAAFDSERTLLLKLESLMEPQGEADTCDMSIVMFSPCYFVPFLLLTSPAQAGNAVDDTTLVNVMHREHMKSITFD